MRKMSEEQIASTQTPEIQAHFRDLIAEPGQATLAYGFFPRNSFPSLNSPLTPMELNILTKCNAPLSTDWEQNNTLWESGDEVCSAYGVLTLKGLISWELRTGKLTWMVPEVTSAGKEILAKKA